MPRGYHRSPGAPRFPPEASQARVRTRVRAQPWLGRSGGLVRPWQWGLTVEPDMVKPGELLLHVLGAGGAVCSWGSAALGSLSQFVFWQRCNLCGCWVRARRRANGSGCALLLATPLPLEGGSQASGVAAHHFCARCLTSFCLCSRVTNWIVPPPDGLHIRSSALRTVRSWLAALIRVPCCSGARILRSHLGWIAVSPGCWGWAGGQRGITEIL
mmetsp:Transcript_80221/g.214331  ORF Transcript_80221/g.214331 Transcript_80221/m.214331 type:complete len:214 (+) Transcript_80221:949-1590(+)